MDWLAGLFYSPFFRYIVVPVGSAILVIIARHTAKRRPFEKKDLAIGFELIVAAIMMNGLLVIDRSQRLITLQADYRSPMGHSGLPDDCLVVRNPAIGIEGEIADATNRLIGSSFFGFLMVLSLWLTGLFVKSCGWNTDSDLRILRGIVAPLVLGFIWVYAVMRGVGQ